MSSHYLLRRMAEDHQRERRREVEIHRLVHSARAPSREHPLGAFWRLAESVGHVLLAVGVAWKGFVRPLVSPPACMSPES